MVKFRYIDSDENSRDPFVAETEGSSEFEQLLQKDNSFLPTSRRYKMGDSVEGTVLSVSHDFVFIDLGGKNSGSLSTEEFKTAGLALPKVGETFNAYVRSDNGSEVILSRVLRASDADDNLLRNAYESKMPIEAKIEKVIKGGFEALIGSKRCFVPLTHMELYNTSTEPEKYIGNTFKFIITELKGRNIVLSRRTILKEELENKVALVLQTLEEGQTYPAIVTRIAEYGAFASFDGVEGLIPISELSWRRVKKVEEVVKVGENINVKISKIERTPRLRISLSLKNAGEDPWIAMSTRLVPGQVLDGTVARMIDNAAFVNVSDGIDGIVPISQITWEKRITHPKDILKVGQAVKVHVLTADLEAHRLSLSIKGPMPEELAKKLEQKRTGQKAMTEEELELMNQWETYKNNEEKIYSPAHRENSSSIAAAFKNASLKKK